MNSGGGFQDIRSVSLAVPGSGALSMDSVMADVERTASKKVSLMVVDATGERAQLVSGSTAVLAALGKAAAAGSDVLTGNQDGVCLYGVEPGGEEAMVSAFDARAVQPPSSPFTVNALRWSLTMLCVSGRA